MPPRILTLNQAQQIRQLKKDRPHLSYGQMKMALHLHHVSNSTLWLVVHRSTSYTNERSGHFKLSLQERRWIRMKIVGYKRRSKERAIAIQKVADGYGVTSKTIYKVLRKVS